MKFTQIVKRGVAMLLTLAMLVSSGNFGMILNVFAETGDHDDHFHANLGQVIIDNLDSLTAQQEYLLESGFLVADEQYHFAPPADAADLVVVDSGEKTITAKDYTDSEGNLWVPTEFALVGDENAILESGVLVADGEVYTGSYTAMNDNFSVHITYSFDLNLSDEEKAVVEAMVNAGAALKADLDIMKYLSDVSVLNDVDQATKDKIIDMVGGVDPNAQLVLKAMVMELTRLGGQTAIDLLASLAKDGIYLPLLEDDGNGNLSINEEGVFVNLGESTSDAYKAALSLKQQQDAQEALDLIKVLEEYMDLCDLALLALQADKVETALKSNYAELGAVSAGLKEVQPVINKYLTETVPGIYATVFGTINDALAAYEDALAEFGIDTTVNSSEEFAALVAELKTTYADGLAQINEKLAGTSYGTVSTPEDIVALKAQLEQDYAANVAEINSLLTQYGYDGAPVTDSTSLQAPIDWADKLYNDSLAELNATLKEYGYTGREVTNSTSMSRPIVWLEDEYLNAIDTINETLAGYGYTETTVTDSESMDAPIAWLDSEYAGVIDAINERLPELRENGVECEDVETSADIDPIIEALGAKREELLQAARDAAAEAGQNINITDDEDVDTLILTLEVMVQLKPSVQPILDQARQLKTALETIADAQEALAQAKEALVAMEDARPLLVDAKDSLVQAEDAMVMLADAQRDLGTVEEAQARIPEVKEKMELAEFAIEALGLMDQLNNAIIQLEDVQVKLDQLDAGVAELEEQEDNLKLLIIIMDGFTATVKPVADAFENDSFNTAKVLRTDLPAATYEEITEQIENATAYTGEIPNKLEVAKSRLIVNVARFNVNVKYTASVVDSTKADSMETVELPAYTDTITLAGGATAAEVLAAIDAMGLQAAALAQWGIDADKFDVQIPALEDGFVLTGDLDYTVVFTPKTYSLTLDFGDANTQVLQVPYGYRYTTQIHEGTNMEYVYTVTTDEAAEVEQGSVVTVLGDTVISRTEGKKAERLDLLDLVAKTMESDKGIQSILTSSALKLSNTFSMRIPGKEQVTVSYNAARQVTVISAPDYASRVGDLKWVATSVTIDGTTYPMTNGVYETTADFALADVHYELALNTEALGFENPQILDALNAPFKLAADYNAQKTTLDELAELLPLLKKLNDEDDIITDPTRMTLREALGMIEHLQASYGLSNETVAAGKALYKLIPAGGHVALYDTMELYTHGRMYHYYRNEDLYKTQITQLDDILMVLVNDPVFMELVEDASHGLFEEIKAKMDAAADVMNNYGVDHSKIDVEDDNLRTLLNLLETAQPTLYSRVPTEFVWQEDIHATGLGYTNVILNVSFGGVTYTEDYVVSSGTTLSVDQLLQWAEYVKAQYNIGPADADYFTVRHDFADTSLTGEAVEFNYTWEVTPYEIKVDGTDVVVGVVDYNNMHLDLPAHTVAGMRYDYMIGDLAVKTGAYELGIDQFKGLVAGTIKVTRTEVNEEQERLQKQEDLLVEFVNNMEGAGIVTKDANGKYAVVFRVDYADVVDSFTRFGMGLFLGGYDHLGFHIGDEYHVLYGEGQYYFQAFVDALLSSGAGTHTFLENINDDGSLVHLELPDTTVITDYSYPTLGAEFMHSVAYFEKDGETLEADFYITLDGTAEAMASLEDKIELIDKYLNITFENNQAIAHLTLPDTAYAAYVTALAATGKIDLRHVNDLDSQVALAFLVELLNPMIDKNSADWDAVMNTGDMLVYGVGVEKVEEAYEKLLDRVNLDKVEQIYEMLTASYDSTKVVYSDQSVYVPLENIRVKEILDLVQQKLNEFVDGKEASANIDLSKIVAEYNTGININLAGHVENIATDYAALYIDVAADGIVNKAGIVTADRLSDIAETANVVILLDDVTGDLNLKGNEITVKGKTISLPVMLDLNGKTLTGNITGDGRVIILDSAYQSSVAPVGTVTGTVTGATILSGKYASDVSALLPDGYVQEADGVVHHKLFTVVDDGANNLTLTLNADYDDLLEMIDVKGLMGVAMDAAMELVMHNYIYSSFYLDGKQVFDIQADDLVGMVASGDKKQSIIDTLKSWVSKEDLKAIAQDVLDAISDYDALYEKLKDGGDGVIYSAQTLLTPYDITTEKIDNNGEPYYTVNIGADTANAKTGSLTVVVVGDMRLELLKLAKALKDVIQNNVSVDISIDDVSADFADKTLFITGDFAGEVIVDLRDHPSYVLTTSVILAYGNPEIRDQMVAAIETYYAEDSMAELEKVYNTLTAKQIIAGWSNVVRGADFFTDMVESLALSDETKAEILAAIDDDMLGFKLAVELGAAILRKLDVDGTDHTLGAFLKTDDSGDNYYGIAKSKDFLGEKGVRGYGVNYDVSIENVSGKLYLFHTHKWDDGVESKAPDCENDGEMLYTCTDCGKTKTESIPALGHLYGDLIPEVPATCTEDGLKAHYHCAVAARDGSRPTCGKYFDENKNEVSYESLIIPANGHDYGDLIPEEPATCTEDGLKAHYQCSVCDAYFNENKDEVDYNDLIIPAGHTYGTLVPEEPASCTETGLKAHYKCSECGKYFDENKDEVDYADLIIPMKAHNYGTLVPEEPASCTETGLKAHYQCSECDAYFDENKNEVDYADLIIPMKAHNYGSLVPEEPASCTEDGLKAHYKCSECGKYFDEEKNEVAYSDLIIPAGHTYGTLVPEEPASCTETGLKAHYKCSECGKYFDENKNEVAYNDLIIPMKDHNYGEWIVEKPASCTETGLKAHYKCSECGKYFDANKNEVAYNDLIIPMKEHNYGEWIVEKPASCTETGLKAHYKCSECGKYFDANKNEVAYADLIIPYAHDYGTLVPEDPASCTEDGLKAHYKCSKCGKYFDENKNEVDYADLIIPAGHTYGTLVPEEPASCTATGLKAHYKCSECGKYFDENKNEVAYNDLIIPMKDHNYGEWIVEKPASCTETGLKAHYYDADCGKYFDENKNEVAYNDLIIPMKEHNYGTLIPEAPASCTATGLKAHYYDADCGKYFDENKNEVAYNDLIIPYAHDYGTLVPEDPASCTEDGLKAHYQCSKCGKYFDENKNEVDYADLIIPAGHNYGILIPEEPASCTATGLKAHYYDADCGKYFDENKNEVAYSDLIIPMKEHNYGNLIPEDPASCTETGLKAHYYDAECGKYFDENKNEVAYNDLIIPMKEHNYGQWVEEVPAEVGKTGLKGHYYDADCDKYFDANKNEVSYESLIIPALSGGNAPLLNEVIVAPADGIYGGSVLTEGDIKYLIVDADARNGLNLVQLHAMFPTIANGVECSKITGVTDNDGAAVTDETSLLATGYVVTFTATNDAGSDTATYILVLLGDINCDGKNTSSDAAAIKKHKLTNEPFGTRAQELAANVNCDSTISSSDANTIKLKVLHSVNSNYAYVTRANTLWVEKKEEE